MVHGECLDVVTCYPNYVLPHCEEFHSPRASSLENNRVMDNLGIFVLVWYAGSPGCPFNQNALLKGHLKGTFLLKKGQKEGKKGQIFFFKAVLQISPTA